MPFFASFTQSTKVYGLLQQLRVAAATSNLNYDSLYYQSSFLLRPVTTAPYTASNIPPTVDYLLVGGGGGGGASQGGGGGGGGFRTGSGYSITPSTTYTIVLGAGGATDANGTNTGIYTTGAALWTSGGGAGQYNNGNAGGSGGGGGAQAGSKTGGAGNIGGYSPSEGNSGGNSNAPCAGGGGGASGSGGTGSAPAGGTGGAGVNTSISGTDTGYSGGGGGGTYPSSSGGIGALNQGGGPGTNNTSVGGNGVVGRGGGGGGGGSVPGVGNGNGGVGGSGTVILRYLNSYTAANVVGASYANTGGYHTYKFNSTGTFGFNSVYSKSNNNIIIDEGSNFVVTSNGSIGQGTFSPFQSYAVYIPGGNYIFHQRDDTLAIGTSDFSIEAWVCRTGAPGGRNWPPFVLDTGGNWLEFTFANSIYGPVAPATGTFGLCAGADGGGIAFTSTVLAPFTWYKVRAQRMGGNFQIYLNDALETTTADSVPPRDFGTTGGSVAKLGFNGYAYSWDQRYYDGYVSDLVVKKANTVVFTTAGVGANGTSIQDFYNPITGNTANTPTTLTSGVAIYSGNSGFYTANNMVTNVPYNQALHGGSGYFSSGNYLTLPNNPNIIPALSDFTLEFNVYHTTGIGGNQMYYEHTGGGLAIYRQGSGKIQVDRSGVVGVFTSSYTIFSDRWHHIALSRTAGTTRLFINGVLDSSTSTSYDFTGTNPNFAIAASPGGGNPFTGYMTNIRFTKNGSLYQSAFVPPTRPLTTNANTTLLLGFTNFMAKDDSSMRNVIRTGGTTSVNTSVTKWGSGSLFFNGSTDYLYLPATEQTASANNNRLAFGTSDFTIEAWIYPNNWDSNGAMITQGGSGAPQFAKYGTNPNLGFCIAGVAWLITDGALPTVGQWSHVAVCRFGTTIKLFINGTQSGSTAYSNYSFTSIKEIGVGDGLGSSWFAGNMEDVRVTPGIALYRENFTPPTQRFANTGLYSVSSTNLPPTVELLVVGGGGGGGNGGPTAYESGGGGAGGLIYMNSYTVTGTKLTATVGAGGQFNLNGSNSSLIIQGVETLTAIGGGWSQSNSGAGKTGGSGGGGTHNSTPAGLGTQTTNPSISANSRTYGFGTNGGNGAPSAGGGGGGAGQAGSNAPSPGGKGGDGKQYVQFAPWGANNSYFAGGGVGAYGSGAGLGGGGGVPPAWTSGTHATINTGGGGGGGAGSGGAVGGNGGSGIIIIRYPSTFDRAPVTGSPIISTANGYHMFAFVGSGSISFN